MATAVQILRHKDERTGKTYAVRVTDHPEKAMEKMIEMAEHDYQKSLPPEKRAVANRPTDFKCPICLTKTEPAVIKKPRVYGGLFFTDTEFLNFFRCHDCGSEFSSRELQGKIEQVEFNNWQALCLEKYKDGEITEDVFMSTVRADKP